VSVASALLNHILGFERQAVGADAREHLLVPNFGETPPESRHNVILSQDVFGPAHMFGYILRTEHRVLFPAQLVVDIFRSGRQDGSVVHAFGN
jgi:hypothetical protein